jgi:hypothetical protein
VPWQNRHGRTLFAGYARRTRIEAWLQSAGKPNEQVMKGRLRELLRM